MRFLCAVVLLFGSALPAIAQDDRGWGFSGSYRGSANADGVVTKAEPMLNYTFNNHFRTYFGVPFYLVNVSSSTTTAGGGTMTGIGNAFVGARLAIDSDAVNYSSTLELTAPTGDKTRGFSTGRVTADWTNRLSRRFGGLTPFGSAGIANTVSDTNFFLRPFTSLGIIGHFEGGTTYDLSRAVSVGASGYAVRASGQQTVVSKLVRSGSGSQGNGNNKNRVFETQSQTVVPADLVNDHGLSAWVTVSPQPQYDFHVGYSRSVNYSLNSLFFGIGFRVGK